LTFGKELVGIVAAHQQEPVLVEDKGSKDFEATAETHKP
jgi:hypothetical protein